MHRTVLRLGSRGTEHRQRTLLAVLSHACTHLLVLALHLYRQVSSVLMHVVHLEYIIGRRQHHLIVLCQNHALQHIGYLRDIGHLDTVGVLVEHVQRKGCHESIAHGVLLIQVPTDGTGFFIPPSPPLVHHQSHALFRVILVHDGRMFLDAVLDIKALAHRPIIIFRSEVRSRTFATRPSGHGIIMERKAVHLVTRLLHHRFRPMQIVFPRPAGYLEQTVTVVIAAVSLIAAIQVGIIFRTHVTAASPTFIAHTDVFHTPRLLATVLLT